MRKENILSIDDASLPSYGRWENTSRWYEARVSRDLFGEWVVLRVWGGKGSNRHGEQTDVVESEQAGCRLIEQIHQIRIRRKVPYVRTG